MQTYTRKHKQTDANINQKTQANWSKHILENKSKLKQTYTRKHKQT